MLRGVLAFVLVALVFTLPLLAFGDRFDIAWGGPEAVTQLQAHGSWAWAVGGGMIVADLVLPVPTTAVMSALGAIYGTLAGGLIAAAASGAAGLVAYGAARLGGARAAGRLLSARDLERTRNFFAGAGGLAVAMSRSLPILPEAVAVMAGVSKMPFRTFGIALVCGSVPTGFMYAGVGALVHQTPALAVALALLIPALLWVGATQLLRARNDGDRQPSWRAWCGRTGGDG